MCTVRQRTRHRDSRLPFLALRGCRVRGPLPQPVLLGPLTRRLSHQSPGTVAAPRKGWALFLCGLRCGGWTP